MVGITLPPANSCAYKLSFDKAEQASPFIRSPRTIAFRCEKCGRLHLQYLGPPIDTKLWLARLAKDS